MKVERKDLKIGTEYFMDGSKRSKGVFKEREGDTIYFDCDKDVPYARSIRKDKEGLVPFADEGDGFEQVLIGDGLTDEDLELINSLKNN